MTRADEVKARLAAELQRTVLAGVMIRDGVMARFVGTEAERDQLFEDCQTIARSIDQLIELRVGEAINGLQANGYIPV